MAEDEPILRVRDLVTYFPLRSGILNRATREVHVVENVSFDLRPGETLPLVEESGCEKSTTGWALLRLAKLQRGEIISNGQHIDTLATSKLQLLHRDIQSIFQGPCTSLGPRQTAEYSILEPLRAYGLLQDNTGSKRIAWLLERVGLLPEHV